MFARRLLTVLTAVFVPSLSSGCIVIAAGGWGCCPGKWSEQRTERISLDAATLRSLDVQTHNGAITFEPLPADAAEAYVIVTKRTRGITADDAEKAMDALEVFAEPEGDGTRLGYRWRGTKSSAWQAEVSFDIKAPGDLEFSAETHNGPIKAAGLAGNVRATTHNGSVNVAAVGDRLHAETHNGSVSVVFAGQDITLITHNGEVSVDLSRCARVDGSITTHNGGVDVTVGDSLSARIDTRTQNGRIRCNVPMITQESSGHRVVGTIGAGEGELNVVTHNGGVRLQKSTG